MNEFERAGLAIRDWMDLVAAMQIVIALLAVVACLELGRLVVMAHRAQRQREADARRQQHVTVQLEAILEHLRAASLRAEKGTGA